MGRRLRRWARRAVLAALAAGCSALAAGGVGMATGHRLLIVRSGSMAPAIAAGDAVVVRAARPHAVRAGDVVTFADPSRSGRLLTHRVRQVLPEPGRFAFVTQGDANTGQERWTMSSDDTLATVVLRLPKAGYGLAGLGVPELRAGLVLVAGLLLSSAALQRIWAR